MSPIYICETSLTALDRQYHYITGNITRNLATRVEKKREETCGVMRRSVNIKKKRKQHNFKILRIRDETTHTYKNIEFPISNSMFYTLVIRFVFIRRKVKERIKSLNI